MNKIKIKGRVFVVGDIHGQWNALFHKIDKNPSIRNCTVICVGDVGIGFPLCNEELCEGLSEKFAHYGIDFLAIRGNHDDKDFFDGKRVWFENYKLLPDYTRLNVNGKNWLLAGGATSIDRCFRKLNISWWPNEVFDFQLDLATQEPVDVLVTHSGPNWLGPNTLTGLVRHCVDSEAKIGIHTLWNELVLEREQHNQLVEALKPKLLFFGHFHESSTRLQKWEDGTETKARIVNEHEFFQVD